MDSVQATNTPQVDPSKLRKTLLTWAIVGAIVIAGSQIGWGNIWSEGVIRPLLNALLFLYAYLGRNFIVAITAFTIVLRLITFPLQIKQIRSSRMMAALQPQMQELQKKYANDKERLVAEQQRLYRESGVNPLSGCLPTLVQLPIWFGLFQAINSILADTPLELMNLGKNVYHGFTAVVNIIPLQGQFLGMNLAEPDPTSIVLPVLVAGTTWLQQKMIAQPSTDAQQASMNQTMQLMMPLMFGYFTTQFSSGLAIYFVISNIVGVAIQWAVEKLEGPPVPNVEAPSRATKRKEKAANGSRKKARKA
jgi:YidC/Oxa1 family membrane protein insertase